MVSLSKAPGAQSRLKPRWPTTSYASDRLKSEQAYHTRSPEGKGHPRAVRRRAGFCPL
jgi:hypothetical protein